MKEIRAAVFAALLRRIAGPGRYCPRVAKVLSAPAPWDGDCPMPPTPSQLQTCPKLDATMTDSVPLQSNPPIWVDDDEINGLPDAFTDKRELWEMVATCTPDSCISAHYSSLSLRVVADFIEHRMEQAAANGWVYQPWRIVNDLRVAAFTADLAIEDGETMPRHVGEMQ